MPETDVYIVRAIPSMGHARRWGAGRPFTKEPQEIHIVEEAQPQEVVVLDQETGRRGIAKYHYNVSPTELSELLADPQLTMVPKGVPTSEDAFEINKLKAEKAELEKKLLLANKE